MRAGNVKTGTTIRLKKLTRIRIDELSLTLEKGTLGTIASAIEPEDRKYLVSFKISDDIRLNASLEAEHFEALTDFDLKCERDSGRIKLIKSLFPESHDFDELKLKWNDFQEKAFNELRKFLNK